MRALAGSAEQIPLPDASVDAVLCGQSMHWFDLSRALPEIARVLVPGGTLGALWNSDDDRVPWVAGLQDAAEGAASPVAVAAAHRGGQLRARAVRRGAVHPDGARRVRQLRSC